MLSQTDTKRPKIQKKGKQESKCPQCPGSLLYPGTYEAMSHTDHTPTLLSRTKSPSTSFHQNLGLTPAKFWMHVPGTATGTRACSVLPKHHATQLIACLSEGDRRSQKSFTRRSGKPTAPSGRQSPSTSETQVKSYTGSLQVLISGTS